MDFVDFVDILSGSSIHACLRVICLVDIRVDIIQLVDFLMDGGRDMPYVS